MTDLRKLLTEATPGPWGSPRLRGYAFEQIKADGFCICDVGDYVESAHHRAPRYGEEQANARLIAMAPDLAAEVLALREENAALREALHRVSLGSQNSAMSKEALGREARTAIRKLTGEA